MEYRDSTALASAVADVAYAWDISFHDARFALEQCLNCADDESVDCLTHGIIATKQGIDPIDWYTYPAFEDITDDPRYNDVQAWAFNELDAQKANNPEFPIAFDADCYNIRPEWTYSIIDSLPPRGAYAVYAVDDYDGVDTNYTLTYSNPAAELPTACVFAPNGAAIEFGGITSALRWILDNVTPTPCLYCDGFKDC